MRLHDKIDEIERYLAELLEIVPEDFQEYCSDNKTRAACERYFEKIIEASVDLAFVLIRMEGYTMPEDDKQAFDILAKEKMITPALALRLKEAKGMRNILAHQYGNVDDELVFESITKDIGVDISGLIRAASDR